MTNDPIGIEGIAEWLDEQELVYAARHAGDRRLRMVFLVGSRNWEVRRGAMNNVNVLYSGPDLTRAVTIFNENI